MADTVATPGKLSRKIKVITFCLCGCENIKERCTDLPTLWA